MPGTSSKPKPVDLVYSFVGGDNSVEHKDDVPIILMHGMLSNKEIWKGVDEDLALKSRKRVYIPDLRNHGESPYNDEYDVEAMTEDIIHLMDKLKISKAIMLGHSLGGKIAVHLALNYPTRVEKIIIEDMRPNGLSTKGLEEALCYFRVLNEMNSIIDKGLGEKVTKDIISKQLNAELKKIDPAIVIEDNSFIPIKCLDGKCQWNFNPMLISVTLKNPLGILNESTGCFNGPSLFIYGRESNYKINEDENGIKKLFPNAQLFGVKGGDHIVHFRPEFIDTVISFINGKKA